MSLTHCYKSMFEYSFFLALPVAVLAIRTFVVLLLALAEPDAQLRSTLVPVQVEGHERVAFALDGAGQAVEFVAVQQELAGAGRLGLDVCRGRLQG